MVSANDKFTTIDEYIYGFPDEVQNLLQIVRETIKAAAPEAIEKISWQMPTFYQNGNLIHFAAHKNHIGIYPAPDAIEEFSTELKPYVKSKGSIHFSLDKPIPVDLLAKIVKFRVIENTKKGL